MIRRPLARRRSNGLGRIIITGTLVLSMTNLVTITVAQTLAPTKAPARAPVEPPAPVEAPAPVAPVEPPVAPPPPTTSPAVKVATLAPFVPLTNPPTTAAPSPKVVTAAPTPKPKAVITSAPITITAAPVSAAPTAPRLPTEAPTLSPSGRPSTTSGPTESPSSQPTEFPTVSHRPTAGPTDSFAPTATPSTSSPTSPPTKSPTLSPVAQPTGSPSTNYTLSIKRACSQVLEIETADKFDEVQMGIYQFLMESYTKEIGTKVGKPQIVTTSEITDQVLGSRRERRDRRERRLQLNTAPGTTKHLLFMDFTMRYESRYGYEVEDYPRVFQNYINTNLAKVTEDMKIRFLPVVQARDVIVFNTKEPTASPVTTKTITTNPTAGPSMAPARVAPPTLSPSASPVTPGPSGSPSRVPTLITSPPVAAVEDRMSFVVGLAAGLGGAALVIMLLIWYMWKRNDRDKEESQRSQGQGQGGNNSFGQGGGGGGGGGQQRRRSNPTQGGMVISDHDDTVRGGDADAGPDLIQQGVFVGDGGPRPPSSPPGAFGTAVDSIFSNPSMVSEGQSFDTDPDVHDDSDALELDPLQDEFDSYKNQDLEFMRSGVEESVYGTEGMMSLAMTRALMEDEEEESGGGGGFGHWGGAEDPESIEANGLCETNDWLRKHDHSTIDERNLFFQEILNKMVVTVRRGTISPSDGTRAVHCCAAMLGLRLERDLPNNVLLVHGMRKTNDLSLGRSYLVEAFRSFGDIEGAAIAPNNRGFGFVRFVSPRSVQRALERFRTSEIDVHDVSVMIRSLRPDAQAA